MHESQMDRWEDEEIKGRWMCGLTERWISGPMDGFMGGKDEWVIGMNGAKIMKGLVVTSKMGVWIFRSVDGWRDRNRKS